MASIMILGDIILELSRSRLRSVMVKRKVLQVCL